MREAKSGSVCEHVPDSLKFESNNHVKTGLNSCKLNSSQNNQTDLLENRYPKLWKWEGFPTSGGHALSAISLKDPPELLGFEIANVKKYVTAYNEFLRRGGRVHPKERLSSAQELQYLTWYDQFGFAENFGPWEGLNCSHPGQFLQLILDITLKAYDIYDYFEESEIEIPIKDGRYDLISHLANCRVVLLQGLRPRRPNSILIGYYLNSIKKRFPRFYDYIVARYQGELLANGKSIADATLEFVFATVSKILIHVSQVEGLSLEASRQQEPRSTHDSQNLSSKFGFNHQYNPQNLNERFASFQNKPPFAKRKEPFSIPGNEILSRKQGGALAPANHYGPAASRQGPTTTATVGQSVKDSSGQKPDGTRIDQHKRSREDFQSGSQARSIDQERFLNGSCYFCGQKGHRKIECPHRAAGVQVTPARVAVPLRGIPATIVVGEVRVEAVALLDSGTEIPFVSRRMVEALKLKNPSIKEETTRHIVVMADSRRILLDKQVELTVTLHLRGRRMRDRCIRITAVIMEDAPVNEDGESYDILLGLLSIAEWNLGPVLSKIIAEAKKEVEEQGLLARVEVTPAMVVCWEHHSGGLYGDFNGDQELFNSITLIGDQVSKDVLTDEGFGLIESIPIDPTVDKFNYKERSLRLLAACKEGNLRDVQRITSLGTHTYAIDGCQSETPLYWAVSNQHDLIVDYLLQEGASVDACNQSGDESLDGKTAVMAAVLINDVNRLKTLLARSGNLDIKDATHTSALAHAVEGANLDMVIALVK